MQKWEYCTVGPIKGNLEGHYPRLVILSESGMVVTKILGIRGLSEDQILAQTIARLGGEGWELVSCGSTGWREENRHMLYFKRPVS